MKYLFRLAFLFYIVAEIAIKGNNSFRELIVILLIVAIDIFRIKYYDNYFTLLIEEFLIAVGSFWNPAFIYLLALTVFDFTQKKFYLSTFFVILYSVFIFRDERIILFLLLTSITTYLGYIKSDFSSKEDTLKNLYDKESRYHYELEQSRARLLSSSKEIAYITEVKERNRISTEIHDNVGHSIAGILIQLRAANKIFEKDSSKAKDILVNSIENLSQALDTLRDTVHNIKPSENLGIEYVKSVIENFKFCQVNFSFDGDFNDFLPNHIEIVVTNIKESLTNASKYSNATEVHIKLETNEKYTRLYIKDNGIGCRNIKAGMGLSGMKERIQNAGGNISVNGKNGFMIVCFLPKNC